MTNGSPVLRTRPLAPSPASIRRPIAAAVLAPETAPMTAAWPPASSGAMNAKSPPASSRARSVMRWSTTAWSSVEVSSLPHRFERLGLLPAAVTLLDRAQPADGHGPQVRDTAAQRGLRPAQRRTVAARRAAASDRLPDVGHGGRDPGGEALEEGIRRPGRERLALRGEHRRPQLERQGGRGAEGELQRAHQPGGTAVARDQPQARLAVDPQEDRRQVGAGGDACDGGDVRHRLGHRGRLQQTAKGREGLPLARAHVVPPNQECPPVDRRPIERAGRPASEATGSRRLDRDPPAAVPELGAEPGPQPVELRLHRRQRAVRLGRRPPAALGRSSVAHCACRWRRPSAAQLPLKACAPRRTPADVRRSRSPRAPPPAAPACPGRNTLQQLGQPGCGCPASPSIAGQLRQRGGVDGPVGGWSALGAPAAQRGRKRVLGDRLGEVVVHAAARHCSRSPCSAFAVMAMIGTCAPRGLARARGSRGGLEAVHLRHLAVHQHHVVGLPRQRRRPPRARWRRRRRGSRASPACRVATRWLTALSSATSTRSRRAGAPAASAPASATAAGAGAGAGRPSATPAQRVEQLRLAHRLGQVRRDPGRARPSRRRPRRRGEQHQHGSAASAGRRGSPAASSSPSISGICSRAAPGRSGRRAARSRVAAPQRRRPPATARRRTPAAELVAQDARGWSRCRPRPARAAPRGSPVAARRRRGLARPRSSAHREPERAALARLALDADLAAHQLDELLARSPAPGRCRRSGASSSRRPGRTARTAASSASGGMPMPVSVTAKRSRTASGAAGSALDRARRPRPRSVNLTALPTRLSSTWRSRPGRRARAAGTSGSTRQASSSPLACAPLGQQLARRPRPRSRRSKSIALELELAGLDLREVEDVVDDRRAAPRRTCAPSRRTRAARGSASVSSSSPVMPITPFIGVRISWLMVARNSLLARLAASAASARLPAAPPRPACAR